MNTKFFFILLLVVLVATACAPAIVDSAAPAEPAAPPVDNENSALLPVTGDSDSPAARAPQESGQWSGEIYFSDSNSPDALQNSQPAANNVLQAGCISEESQPRRQSGCVE